MFGSAAWRRYRSARAKAACERAVRELSGRAAVREAEDLVESAWIAGLDRAGHTDPTVRRVLEHERAVFVQAARRRVAEAEKDRQRWAEVEAEMAQKTPDVPPAR